jgi:hypothetical protein
LDKAGMSHRIMCVSSINRNLKHNTETWSCLPPLTLHMEWELLHSQLQMLNQEDPLFLYPSSPTEQGSYLPNYFTYLFYYCFRINHINFTCCVFGCIAA